MEYANTSIGMNIDKLDNLFVTSKKTPIQVVKSTLQKFTNNIITQFENNQITEDIYIGTITDNNINGCGLLITDNCIMIEGQFNSVNNIINGQVNIGTDICLKGVIKNGEFLSGTLNNKNVKIVGTFNEGLPDGSIKYFENNILYEGMCKKGLFEGIGYYKNPKFSYEGEWENNRFNGRGIYNTDDFSYNGTFRNGKKHGDGKVQMNNQEFFIEYEDDIEINRLDYNEKKIEDLQLKISTLKENDNNNIIIIKEQEDQIIEYNNRLKTIENKYKKLEEELNCKVCFKNTCNIVLQPCNHNSICEECELSIRNSAQGKKCPVCRKQYRNYIKIYT